MLFVNTSLDVAQQRNMMRARKLDPNEVEEMWKAVQQNMGKFQQYFDCSGIIFILFCGRYYYFLYGFLWSSKKRHFG